MTIKDRIKSVDILSPVDYLSDEQVFIALKDLKDKSAHRGFVLVRERTTGDRYHDNLFMYHTTAAFNRVIKPYFNSNSVYCGKRFRAFSLANNANHAGGLSDAIVEHIYSAEGKKIETVVFNPLLNTGAEVSVIIAKTIFNISDKLGLDFLTRTKLLEICSKIVNRAITFEDIFINVIYVLGSDKVLSINTHPNRDAAFTRTDNVDETAVASTIYKLHYCPDNGNFFFSLELPDQIKSPLISIVESKTTVSRTANATSSMTIQRGLGQTVTEEDAAIVEHSSFRKFCSSIEQQVTDYYLINKKNLHYYARVESGVDGSLLYIFEYSNTDKNRVCKILHDKSFNANYLEFWVGGADNVYSVYGYMYCGNLSELRTKNIIIDYIFNKAVPSDCIRLK
jgi:hypothetical protein